jgi:hypothetical protein
MRGITVAINTPFDSMEFERNPFFGVAVGDSPGDVFRMASAELRRIADDIDRMYPRSETSV